jgi:hypothetical protein
MKPALPYALIGIVACTKGLPSDCADLVDRYRWYLDPVEAHCLHD